MGQKISVIEEQEHSILLEKAVEEYKLTLPNQPLDRQMRLPSGKGYIERSRFSIEVLVESGQLEKYVQSVRSIAKGEVKMDDSYTALSLLQELDIILGIAAKKGKLPDKMKDIINFSLVYGLLEARQKYINNLSPHEGILPIAYLYVEGIYKDIMSLKHLSVFSDDEKRVLKERIIGNLTHNYERVIDAKFNHLQQERQEFDPLYLGSYRSLQDIIGTIEQGERQGCNLSGKREKFSQLYGQILWGEIVILNGILTSDTLNPGKRLTSNPDFYIRKIQSTQEIMKELGERLKQNPVYAN